MNARLAMLTLAAGAAGLVAAAQAGTVDTAECRRDLLVLDSELSVAQSTLVKAQEGPRGEQCEVWRGQVTLFKKAAATYRRCKTDTERRVMSAQMDSQALDFQSALNQVCKGK